MAAIISSVSGSISHGSTIVISGSGFGSKTRGTPLLWGGFEGGVVGASAEGCGPTISAGALASYTAWEKSGDNSLLVNSSSPLVNTTKHARVTFSSSSVWYTFVSIPYAFSTAGQKIYISFNYRYNFTSSYPRQCKALIWYDSDSVDKMYMSTAFDTYESGGWRMHVTQSGETWLGVTGPEITNEWVRLENYIIQSDVSVANGFWESAIIRNGEINGNTRTSTLRTESISWVQLALGGAYYSMGGSNPGTVDINNIYIDDTPQRVEIGNSPIWDSCTYREILIPSAWSDTSITASFRQGVFANGATVYLFVVGSDNTRSSGKAITIGGTSVDITPDAFSFTDVTGATRSTQYTSNSITVSGLDGSASVSITGGTYSKNGATYTSAAGTCVNGDVITVRVISSSSYSTTLSAVLTIGLLSDTYSVTTSAAPSSPVINITADPILVSLSVEFEGASSYETFYIISDPVVVTLTSLGVFVENPYISIVASPITVAVIPAGDISTAAIVLSSDWLDYKGASPWVCGDVDKQYGYALFGYWYKGTSGTSPIWEI